MFVSFFIAPVLQILFIGLSSHFCAYVFPNLSLVLMFAQLLEQLTVKLYTFFIFNLSQNVLIIMIKDVLITVKLQRISCILHLELDIPLSD